jgi:hypothetical protein
MINDAARKHLLAGNCAQRGNIELLRILPVNGERSRSLHCLHQVMLPANRYICRGLGKAVLERNAAYSDSPRA